LCFFNCSNWHTTLAKRLLHHFPKLIDDIYTCDEFYGIKIFFYF
jgi:transient receptor potential cation channel subfamily V protein 5